MFAENAQKKSHYEKLHISNLRSKIANGKLARVAVFKVRQEKVESGLKENGEEKRMATAQRPSLVSLSSEMLRMRRAIEKGAAMCPPGEGEGA